VSSVGYESAQISREVLSVIGKVYAIPPQPVDTENTRWFPAGVVTIGVEYRDVDPAGLIDTYKDNPDHLAELTERSPQGGFADEGVSLHVAETDGGHEYLRFDAFDDEPHYHYIHLPASGEVVNNVIDFDTVAHGDMLTWAFERIRTRLPEMLAEAGGSHLVPGLDRSAVTGAVDQAEPVARQARQEFRERRARGGAPPSAPGAEAGT
jgi:hypothetical protein